MDLKWIVLVVVILTVFVNHQVEAEIESRHEIWSARTKEYKNLIGTLSAWDEIFKRYYLEENKSDNKETETEFYFGHYYPKHEDVQDLGLECAPGRTFIKIEQPSSNQDLPDSSGEEDDFALRSHMNWKVNEEHCKICICSSDGEDMYCSKRPAMNVNECIRMSKLTEEFNSNGPYEHTRTLAHRIRRDYIWHKDEIPYEARAKCRRGTSYYSNSVTANDTDIDVASDVNSLLDYSNENICFYCICSITGRGVGCINRSPWFCEYFRQIRQKDGPRDMYTRLFEQDRPTYFRQLSWRLRRTMDNGIYDYTSAVAGDDGGDDGGDVINRPCVPFMSEYTNCNPENECTGCTRCSCLADRKWSCQEVKDCGAQNKQAVDLEGIQDALFQIENNFASFHRDQAASSKTPFVPRPPDQDLLLGLHSSEKVLDFDIASLYRNKRSVDNNNKTSVKFYHTVDELNEDTLKNHNMSGTLQAQKVGVVKTPQISRRTGVFPTDNASQLRIAYTAPKAHDPHLADNQIEARHEDDQYDTLSHDKLHTISNHTQKQKDKDLSKIIVNELKPGKEIIGDKKAKVMSNITFTPANDTLTAMAFIAGNLLNKLWNMEKESGEDSIEIEVLKHEKISDLLDLFKEPLNLRQENFLKTALEQLSEAIHKNGNPQNVSLCDKIEEVKGTLRSANSSSEELIKKKDHKDSIESTIKETSFEKNPEVVTEAITKINDVLHLINKFQKIQKDLSDLKRKSNDINESVETKVYNKNKSPKDIGLTQDESTSLNTFGKILEKITKLLLPPKKSKKMAKSIRNQNVLKNSNDIAKQIKTMFNIDIDSSNLTPKDKIIFDYLSSVKRNPNCLLDSLSERNQSPITKTEGDILLNLSEFFKVKSFVDLLKMLETDTKTNTRTKDVLTTTEPEIVTEMTTTTLSTTTKVSKKLQDTKEKLKAHLKNIIDDLIELQNAKGKPTTNVSIVDALPCIYNILNADKNTQDTSLNVKTATVSPASKVASIFNSLKQELLASQTRRSNIITGERPKSAEVWERIIKHGDSKQNTRRNLEIKEPKTFEELKKLMDSIESGSKTYKNRAIMNGVPPSQRLVLLKTLFEDVRAYINVLEDIDNSMTNFEGLSTEKKTDLRDFVNNAEMNINLDEKISTHINNLKVKNNYIRGSDNKTIKKSNERNIPQKSMKLVDLNSSQERNNVKLSRNSIINQLIKNRMELYVKLKESHNADIDTDINYSIAKKILTYLEMGNYSLARELYKIIVPQKPKTPNVNRHSGTPIKRPSLFAKEPVVQFVEPRGQSQLQWLNQDIWLKQLSNLKNMRA